MIISHLTHDTVQTLCQWRTDTTPVNTKHLYSICTTAAQRLRRWSDIVQMLYKCFVYVYPACRRGDRIISGGGRRLNTSRQIWRQICRLVTGGG